MSGINLDQTGHIRAVFHRFRACKPEHQDGYHDECPDCILIETNSGRCEDAGHTRDKSGHCLTCELLDHRIAEIGDSRILSYLRKLKG